MAETHPVDRIELGGIVTIRDALLAQQRQGRKVYRLESGDPSFSIPGHVAEALAKAIRDGHTHYTPGAGIPELRQALFEKLVKKNHLPLTGPDQVLVTNGAMHGLYIAYRALLDPGDEVLVPDPTWTETADNVLLAGGEVVRVPLNPQLRYEAAAVAEKITPRTKALVINSPHNPTGTVMTREEVQAMVELAAQHGVWIISDEAYEDILFDGRTHLSPGSLGYERVISLYSFSKSYAMSGLRLGYVACTDPQLLERMTKLLRCTINGVNSATQHAGVAAVTGPQDHLAAMVAEYQKRRDVLWGALAPCRLLHPFKPEGAFYLWAAMDAAWEGYQGQRDGWAMTRYLIDAFGVGSSPGEVFGPQGKGFIRFAFACSSEQVEGAAELLRQAFA
ncbi:MAG: pyridoxal phosphate-dependent aminotransferase [Acidobacteriota bacterium]